MEERKVISGNHAAAYAAMLSRAQVIPIYPITPQTAIVERLSKFRADKELNAKIINVESEHSAMAACISASTLGARTFTATSSQGLSLMHELLIWASGARLPIVIAEVSRAMAPPWNVWADHLDVIAERDTGWIQLFCESNQEVIDTIIMLYRLCEMEDVLLPAMAIMDAFILSHTLVPVSIPDRKSVDRFLPEYDADIDPERDTQRVFGSVSKPDQYMEFRYEIDRAMRTAKKRIPEIDNEFERAFGRSYHGLIEGYRADDAEIIIVINGSAVSTARHVVDELRISGKKVGLIKIRTFRPFPAEELAEGIASCSRVGVIDRSYSFGHGGAMFTEIRSASYGRRDMPSIKNYIAGLGGRDLTPEILKRIFEDLMENGDDGSEIAWVDLAGEPTIKNVGVD